MSSTLNVWDSNSEEWKGVPYIIPNTDKFVMFTHTKVGTVNQLIGPANVTNIMFVATESWAHNDTLEINSVQVEFTLNDFYSLIRYDIQTGQLVAGKLVGNRFYPIGLRTPMQNATLTFDIDPATGDDSTGNVVTGAPYKTISAVLKAVEGHIGGVVVQLAAADYTSEGQILLDNSSWKALQIQGASDGSYATAAQYVLPKLAANFITGRVNLVGVSFNGDASSPAARIAECSGHFMFSSSRFIGQSSAHYGLNVTNGSVARANNCYIQDCSNGVFVDYAGKLNWQAGAFGTNGTHIRCSSGGIVQMISLPTAWGTGTQYYLATGGLRVMPSGFAAGT